MSRKLTLGAILTVSVLTMGGCVRKHVPQVEIDLDYRTESDLMGFESSLREHLVEMGVKKYSFTYSIDSSGSTLRLYPTEGLDVSREMITEWDSPLIEGVKSVHVNY